MYPKERKPKGTTGIKIEDYSSRAEYKKNYNKEYREKYSEYFKQYQSLHKKESKRNEVVRKILNAFNYSSYKDQIILLESQLKELKKANADLLKAIKKDVDDRLNKK